MSKALMLTVLVVLVLVFTPVVVAVTYKWFDSEGRTHFSDIPPPQRQFEVVCNRIFPHLIGERYGAWNNFRNHRRKRENYERIKIRNEREWQRKKQHVQKGAAVRMSRSSN